MVIICGIIVQTQPSGRPAFTTWHNARCSLRLYGNLTLEWKTFIWSTFDKKMQQIFGKTLFFFFWSSVSIRRKLQQISGDFVGLQLHLARKCRKNITRTGAPRNVHPAPKNIYPARIKFSILARLWPGCTQRLRTNDSILTKPFFV